MATASLKEKLTPVEHVSSGVTSIAYEIHCDDKHNPK
jgi:hypothetical protein